jgi:hypothetical protein
MVATVVSVVATGFCFGIGFAVALFVVDVIGRLVR